MTGPESPHTAVNGLVAALPKADREYVYSACELVELDFNTTIYAAGDTIRHVYFPTASYISLISPDGGLESIEVGLIGNEGVFGVTLLYGVKTSPLRGLVQGGGPCLRMAVKRFTAAVDANTAFRAVLNRYLYILTAQIAQTAACNRYHVLDARLGRWLLMTQDRAHSDTFRLTHEFLAYMLGVRRTGVTEAAGRFQKKGLIRYARGVVTVLDRSQLETIACPCYQAFRAIYAAQLYKSFRLAVSSPLQRRISPQ